MRLSTKDSSKYTIEIIKCKERWNHFLNEIGEFDFYHTFDYHQVSIVENQTPVLFVYAENNILIAIPFVISPIKDSVFSDITSVYGYVGPISKNIHTKWDNSDLKLELNKFFVDYRIISVFSRLNPFIENQELILDNIGSIKTIGTVVNIDLSQNLNEQRRRYSKITKRYLNKIDKLFTFKISDKKEDILRFMQLYYENMDRVNASENYYFDNDYFFKLINGEGFETDVIHAILNETSEVVSSAVMVRTNKKIVQYHVSGTLDSYLRLTPMRFLIDKMRIFASQKGYVYFNLGGGVGGKQDSLFQFKSSFSKDFKDFKIWKVICNKEVYNNLVAERNGLTQNQKDNFFPLYRA